MKELLLVFSIFALSNSCSLNDGKTDRQKNQSTFIKENFNENIDIGNVEHEIKEIENEQDASIKRVSSNPPIKVDTVIQNIYISYSVIDNDNIITQEIADGYGEKDILYYADRSLYLTIKKNGKFIIDNKRFDKKYFSSLIPIDEQEKHSITFFGIKDVNPYSAIFFLTICEPDTDVCYIIQMSITYDGEILIKEELQENIE